MLDTQLSCPVSVCRHCAVCACHTLMVPSAAPAAIVFPSREIATAETPGRCGLRAGGDIT